MSISALTWKEVDRFPEGLETFWLEDIMNPGVWNGCVSNLLTFSVSCSTTFKRLFCFSTLSLSCLASFPLCVTTSLNSSSRSCQPCFNLSISFCSCSFQICLCFCLALTISSTLDLVMITTMMRTGKSIHVSMAINSPAIQPNFTPFL